MVGKALCFVTGHPRPAVAPLGARYVRRHSDGTPMLANGTRDTLAACEARKAGRPEPERVETPAAEAPAPKAERDITVNRARKGG